MIKRIIFIFVVFAFIFAVLELSLRVLRPQPTYSKLLLLTGEQYSACPFIPFTLKRNYKAKSPSQEHFGKFVTITTNSLGLRGAQVTYEKPQNVKRILVLGDSYTFGVYVDDSQTYPAVLDKLFKDQGSNVQVINAGYADGFGPDSHYAWLLNEGLKFEPDIIIYGFFIGNDIGDIKSQYWIKKDQAGLPKRIINPDLYVDDFGRLRSKNEDEKTVGVGPIYKIPILRESHFAVWVSRRINRMSKGNCGWGKDPFPFILKSTSDPEMLVQEQLFLKIVKGMADISKANKAGFLILMIPINFQVDPDFLPKVLGNNSFSVKRNYFSELKPKLEALDIKYFDLLEGMQVKPGHYYPSNGEVHFNPNGHRFVAESIKIFFDKYHRDYNL